MKTKTKLQDVFNSRFKRFASKGNAYALVCTCPWCVCKDKAGKEINYMEGYNSLGAITLRKDSYRGGIRTEMAKCSDSTQ